MALALIITLEKELPDATAAYAKSKAMGKAVAREADRVDSAARRKGVEPLRAMLSESQAALRAQLEADGFDPSKMRLAPERWFDAAQGLKSVRALIEFVNANLNDFKQPNPILRDLKSAEMMLTAAEAVGVKFHFSNGDL